MAIISVFGKLAHAAHRGVWLGVVWALMAGSGLAATALLPWDGTEASINVLAAGEYSISAATDQVYVLTSKGSPVRASIDISVWQPAVATFRLRQLDLAPQGVVLKISGTGTVRIVSEVGISKLRNMLSSGGNAIVMSSAGSLVFSGHEAAPLWIFAQGSKSTVGRAIVAPEGCVSVERGKLRLLGAGAAEGGTNKTAWVAPVIEAKQVAFAGGETSVGFFVTTSKFDVGNVKDGWPLVVKAEKVSFEKGVLRSDASGGKIPPSGNLTSPTNSTYINETVSSIYRYPEASFGAVQAVAMGGQVGEKAFLRVQTEGTVSAEALAKHIVSGTTGASSAAEAVSVDTERGVVAVDVTACPAPKWGFADESMAGAVELFGCIPTVTEEGARVDYDFGIYWIAPVRVEGEPVFRVAVRAAVRLPQETAQSKTFKLVVTRTLDDSEKEVIFEGAASFARCSKADTLYETAPLLTSDTFSGACGIYRYRVTASKAE